MDIPIPTEDEPNVTIEVIEEYEDPDSGIGYFWYFIFIIVLLGFIGYIVNEVKKQPTAWLTK